MSAVFTYRNRLMISTALIALSLIGYQLAIIQLLSYTQWYHYANMVISIALLGFGTAGTLLSILRQRILPYADVLLPLLMMLSGIAMTVRRRVAAIADDVKRYCDDGFGLAEPGPLCPL
jgi:hypothetical protein